MRRKTFLSMAASALAIPAISAGATGKDDDDVAIQPRYLRPGSRIGITSPAGFITLPEIEPAIQLLQSWGYEVKIGSTIGKRDFTFGGTDAERAADMQQMLDDPDLSAILCARGGYGSVRIVDQLNWNTFRNHPKWIIGFSDVTVLHAHLNRKLGIASIHSKMCNSFPMEWTKAEPIQVDTILSIRTALSGTKMNYPVVPHLQNRTGSAEGVLVGGNLKTIESLAGSASDIQTRGKLLFVEDTGEYLYSIDRMFWNLSRTGKLAGLKGLIVGGFKLKADDAGEEFGQSLYQIVLDHVKSYSYPVCFDFPVGHQKNNFALKCGVRHRLEVWADNVTLQEI